MNHFNCNQDIFQCVVDKATLKQEVYRKTFDAFQQFKQSIRAMTTAFHRKYKDGTMKIPIPFEFRDVSEFEIELKFGGDILIFLMHSNIFEFSRDHEVMKTSYLRNNHELSYCGMIMIFNFLADSFKYNRINDSGYLIGRVFINNQQHYFLEGKKEIGLVYNNFASNVLDKKAVDQIIRSAIQYTINFDLLTPPYENMKEVTVAEMQTEIDLIKLKTGKRLGFRFQADHEEVSS